MSIVNPSFETAGATPGSALGWTLTGTGTAEAVEVFGTPALPYEGFEWDTTDYIDEFVDAGTAGNLADAAFDTAESLGEPYEDFNELWGNTPYSYEFAGLDGSFTGGAIYDGFETGWNNDNYEFAFAADLADVQFESVTLGAEQTFTADPATDTIHCTGHGYSDSQLIMMRSIGGILPEPLDDGTILRLAYMTPDAFFLVYPGGATSIDLLDAGTGTLKVRARANHECFETKGWRANENYVFAFSSGLADAAFDGASPTNVEDFEEVPTEKTFTASVANNSFNCTGHGLTTGQPVRMRNIGGHLPGPYDADATYYAAPIGLDDFQLATFDGGAPITILSAGTGTQKMWVPDETLYWDPT